MGRIVKFEEKHRPGVISLGLLFVQASEAFLDFSPQSVLVTKFHDILDVLLDETEPNSIVLFVYEDSAGIPVGFIFGELLPLWLDSKTLVFHERAWYVLPGHRGRMAIKLLTTAMDWADNNGAKGIILSSLPSSDERLYNHLGFQALERHWYKSFSQWK